MAIFKKNTEAARRDVHHAWRASRAMALRERREAEQERIALQWMRIRRWAMLAALPLIAYVAIQFFQ